MDEIGYVLHTEDRMVSTMQLAAHFTNEAMRLSMAEDVEARLTEQLRLFEQAFRSIVAMTSRPGHSDANSAAGETLPPLPPVPTIPGRR